MNKVLLMGRLTREPELRCSQNGNVVLHAGLAVDRKYKQDGEQTADFPSIVAFGKTAEFIEKYFHKGSKILIEGRLQTGNYTNKDGVKVYTTDVVAESVEFCESKKADDSRAEVNNEFMNIPDALEDEGLPFE